MILNYGREFLDPIYLLTTEWVNGLLELARSVFQIERHFLGKASRIALRCPFILL